MPPLVVLVPDGYEAERRYIADVLLREILGLDFTLRRSDNLELTITEGQSKQLTFGDGLFRVQADDWLTPRALPQRPVKRWRVPAELGGDFPADAPLPVLYGGDPAEPGFLKIGTDRIHLDLDLFGSAFFLLTRYEELVEPRRDSWDRFPSTASVARQEQLLTRPLVNEYVELLWTLLQRLWPQLVRKSRQYEVHMSHDVDTPLWTLKRGWGGLARSLAADLLKRREPSLAVRRTRSWLESRRGRFNRDPNATFEWIMTESERAGRRSAFYFIASTPEHDPHYTYDLQHPWLQQLLQQIDQRGHEIGLHGSLNSFDKPELLREELQRLQAALPAGAERVEGGRQHYLRWHNPTTWQAWEDAGLVYDSTLGYADHSGFRSGVCYEYPAFNLLARRPLRLRERPLVVMDTSLFVYQQLDLDTSLRTILELAAQCRRYHGTMTVLWHNDQLITKRARQFYRELCRQL